jgi:hypothetical protein
VQRYFVDCEPLADAVVRLLRDGPPRRPTTLWLGANSSTAARSPGPTVNGRNPWLSFSDAVA